MKKSIYEIRTKKLSKLLKEKDIGGFLFGLSTNMYYFTGFYGIQSERLLVFFVPSEGKPFFLVPEVNYGQIKENTCFGDIIPWNELEDPFGKIAIIISQRGLSISRIAIEDTLRSSFLLALQKKLPEVRFISGNEISSVLRRKKLSKERDLMMNLGKIHDKVYEKAISAIKVGVSELEIANIIVSAFKEYGAIYGGLIPIVASGKYSAHPHYTTTNKVILDGESVLLDSGGVYKYYRSDMSRTVFVGNPPEEYLKVYNIVRKAQETGVQSVKPGRTCEEIDQIVRKVIEDEGYGQYFIHRTGHGIGLDVHEEPYIIEGNKLVLEPGMTFSIKPGIYLPGKYGVRIEDCVIVTEKGAESFTNFTHDLITI